MHADKRNFTHYASYYGVPCYYNIDTGMLAGRNMIFDRLIPVITQMHNYLIAPFNNQGFPIRLKDEIH